MISEEIGLNHFLEQETGVKIYEREEYHAADDESPDPS